MNILTDMIIQYENHDIVNMIDLMKILYHANDTNEIISKIAEIPDLKKVWCFLGILYELDCDIPEAIRCFKKSSKYELIENYNDILQYCSCNRLLNYYSGSFNPSYKNIIERKILLYKLNQKSNHLPVFEHFNISNLEDDGVVISALIELKTLKKQHQKDMEENKLLKEQLRQQQEYITELEYMPYGIKYQQCKEHFEILAKQ